MNKFRNEMEIALGSEKILLRPTFENIAAMETNVAGFAYLAMKFSRGRVGGILEQAKSMPSLSECAQIIYYNQAEKKYNLEEVWDLVQQEGLGVIKGVTIFLAKITAGKEKVDDIESAGEEKKIEATL